MNSDTLALIKKSVGHGQGCLCVTCRGLLICEDEGGNWHSWWARVAQDIKATSELYLTEIWGSRCQDFQKDCMVCQKWAALDALLGDSPHV
jgi:hypothetical protein